MIPARPAEVFAYLDDPAHLVAHMAKPSWSMAGGSMELVLDERRGRELGSRMQLKGRMLGVSLFLEEEVMEREPPRHKAWQTTGAPRLIVIAAYRMGFDVAPEGAGSRLRVFIDYTLPERAPARWLGRLLGPAYARWCTERMAQDTVRHFAAAQALMQVNLMRADPEMLRSCIGTKGPSCPPSKHSRAQQPSCSD